MVFSNFFPHLFRMGHRFPRARRGDLLAQRGGGGAPHDGHGGPAEPRDVAAEIQRLGTWGRWWILMVTYPLVDDFYGDLRGYVWFLYGL